MLLACCLQVKQVPHCAFQPTEPASLPFSVPILGRVCVSIVNETTNDSILLWLLIFFSFSVWFWIKIILIHEVDFQCGSKAQKTPAFGMQSGELASVYLPPEPWSREMCFVTNAQHFPREAVFVRLLPTNWCLWNWASCIEVSVNKTEKAVDGQLGCFVKVQCQRNSKTHCK